MGDVYATLLGPPEVRLTEQVLLFSKRKEIALLPYLVMKGRLQLRKQLGSCALCEKRLDRAKGGDAHLGRPPCRKKAHERPFTEYASAEASKEERMGRCGCGGQQLRPVTLPAQAGVSKNVSK